MFILSLCYFHSQTCQLLGKFWKEIFSNEQNIFEILFHHKMFTILFSTINKHMQQHHAQATEQTTTEQNNNNDTLTIFFSFLHLNNLKPIINQRDLGFFKCGGVWAYQLQDSWFRTTHEPPSLVVGHTNALVCPLFT